MKKIFFFLLLCLVGLLVAIYFVALPHAEKKIISSLNALGFNDVTIQQKSFHLDGISFDKIYLDAEKFSAIENLKVNLFWPLFIFRPQIKEITIQNINFISLDPNFRKILFIKNRLNTQSAQLLPADIIKIENFTWDNQTNQGAIRLEGHARITPSTENKPQDKDISLALNAAQNQLGLTSEWTGTINENGLSFAGEIKNLNINQGHFSLRRGVGWVTYQATTQDTETPAAIAGQIDAGNGNLMGLGLRNLSFVLGSQEQDISALFRASAAGLQGVSIRTDITKSDIVENEFFETILQMEDLKAFMEYLKTTNQIDKDIDLVALQSTPSRVKVKYMPERKFPNGPLPFDLIITQHNQKDAALSSTFLIYPDSLDIRGTAEGRDAFVKLAQDIWDIPAAQVNENIIRIDGNLSPLLEAE